MAIRTMGPSGQCDNEPGAAEAALPELLAPAGGLDQMLAAIAAGADAIYAGLGGFNARVSAHGFTDDEFLRGCAVAHAHGVRVYVTLNVFVFDDELADAVALGAHAHELGADALIVADAGLACALRAVIPGVEIHLSTQAGVHSEGAVRLAADELGVERVTTARELGGRRDCRPVCHRRAYRGVLPRRDLHWIFGRLRVFGPAAWAIGDARRLYAAVPLGVRPGGRGGGERRFRGGRSSAVPARLSEYRTPARACWGRGGVAQDRGAHEKTPTTCSTWCGCGVVHSICCAMARGMPLPYRRSSANWAGRSTVDLPMRICGGDRVLSS